MKYFNEGEVSRITGLSARTLQRQRLNGDGIPYTRLGARRIGYSETAITVWEAGRTFIHRAAEIAGQVGLS